MHSSRRTVPPRHGLKYCGRFSFLFAALVMAWMMYLCSVLWMAVGVHKLDPTLPTNTTMESRGLLSLHHVVAQDSNLIPKFEHIHSESFSVTKNEKPNGNTEPNAKAPSKIPPQVAEILAKQWDEAQAKKEKNRRPGYEPNPFGHMVAPEKFLNDSSNLVHAQDPIRTVPTNQVLTAYLEPIDQSTWDVKPLPVRNVSAKDLVQRLYTKLNSCRRLPEQWPVDDYPDEDPFLPWIHDVFPTHDGKFIQFVAQNKRRCHTGTTPDEEAILHHTAPQVALFQHVPLKVNGSTYRLASHEEADIMATRFICRFRPSGEITFSVFNNDYEWVGFRKKIRKMFSESGRDNKQIHTSQLLFRCPVPPDLIETVRNGESVVNDWATLFVDLIPIRTPPRYGPPEEFLTPHYAEGLVAPNVGTFDPNQAWGSQHFLPPLEHSGRWENIPICKPSLMTYEPQRMDSTSIENPGKQHNLVSCLWTSTGYATRGNRYAINDGQRRLVEWITFNKMIGFDHFYIYDNSGAFSNESSLLPVANLFPEDVTLIRWPSRVCNNNPNNVDSVGERSSQYAAESSCRLRFGPHVNWIGQFDIDEYLVPMGNYSSVLPLLEKLDQENTKIISFASWRAWPRMTHINPPIPILDKTLCGGHQHPCFELSIRNDTTFLEGYNCDRQLPGKKTKVMPAEKQIYRADYVTQHFIHYSTVTQTTNLKKGEFEQQFQGKRLFPDPLSRFVDEVNEALMLHSKAVARQDTAGWQRNCHVNYTGRAFDQCRLGIPWPDGEDENNFQSRHNRDGWLYDCYANKRIDNFWGPKLQDKLSEQGLLG